MIHLFAPSYEVEECLAAVRECLEVGWTGVGFKTDQFEAAWKEYADLPHAHFLSSATAGLHLALRILRTHDGWADGDEVITTPLTFVSTNHAILYERLAPVFADIDETLCLDPDSVARRITPRTRAVMFVGFGGNCGRLAQVADLCRARGLRLVLDAAHMAGTRRAGRHIGREADATVFSYHAVKNLPTADAGMICFREAEDDLRARRLSWLGISKNTYERTHSVGPHLWRYDVDEVGYKYHGNSIMAAIGLVQLRYLDRDNGTRRQIASWYRERLSGVAGATLTEVPAGCEPSTHLFTIRVAHRDDLILGLNSQGIYPGVHYRDNTEYPPYRFGAGSCPRAARASRELLSLPMHLRLTREDVDRVASAIRSHLAG
jgi:dTDP-4-amino-4,6-dideoxygalactose transaminase